MVTGAWRGTNTDKIYEELGWESLYHRRYYRRMTLFYKIVNECTPEYLRAPINLARVKPYSFRNSNVLEPINSRTNRFASSFYPFCVREWNNLESSLRVLPSISQFKTAIIRIISPPPPPPSPQKIDISSVRHPRLQVINKVAPRIQ